MADELSNSTIIYQLEKVGGDITELFESRMEMLADAWNDAGYGCDYNENGQIEFEDGRTATLTFQAVVYDAQ